MTIAQVEVIEAEIAESVTDADFVVAPHAHSTLKNVNVCRVCGRIVPLELGIGGQDPFPRFGADECLTW